MYKGNVEEKYERARRTAQQKLDQQMENEAKMASAESATAIEEPVRPQGVATPRMSRKKATSISSPAGNFKDLTNMVNSNLHGRRANVLGMESSH